MIPFVSTTKRIDTFAKRVAGIPDVSHAWVLPNVVDLIGGVSLTAHGTHLTTTALFDEAAQASRVEESGYWELASPPAWDRLNPWTAIFVVQPDKTGAGNLTLYSTWDSTSSKGIHIQLIYGASIQLEVVIANGVGNRCAVRFDPVTSYQEITNQETAIVSIHHNGTGLASGVKCFLAKPGFAEFAGESYGKKVVIEDTLSATNISGKSAYIGRRREGAADLYRGDVQAVALASRDLASSEVGALALGGLNAFPARSSSDTPAWVSLVEAGNPDHFWALPDLNDRIGSADLIETGVVYEVESLAVDGVYAKEIRNGGYWQVGTPNNLDFTDSTPFTLCFMLSSKLSDLAVNEKRVIYSKRLTSAPYTGLYIDTVKTTDYEAQLRVLLWDVNQDRVQFVTNFSVFDQYQMLSPGLLSIHYDGASYGDGIKVCVNGLLVNYDAWGQAARLRDEWAASSSSAATAYFGHDDFEGDSRNGEFVLQGAWHYPRNVDQSEMAIIARAVLGLGDLPTVPANPQLISTGDNDSDIADLHHLICFADFHNRGLCNWVGHIVTSDFTDLGGDAVGATYTILKNNLGLHNTVGLAQQTGSDSNVSGWIPPVMAVWAEPGKSFVADFPNAVTAMRTWLAGCEDGSVIWATDGTLKAEEQLLLSPADGISPLTGTELVAAKVAFSVHAWGMFPDSGLLSVGDVIKDPSANAYVVANWPTPMIFSSYQDAFDVFGGGGYARNPLDGPWQLGCREDSEETPHPITGESWDVGQRMYISVVIHSLLETNNHKSVMLPGTVTAASAAVGNVKWTRGGAKEHYIVARTATPAVLSAETQAQFIRVLGAP